MNWNQVKGNWKQVKGRVKQEWGDLTDDQLTKIEGHRDRLVGELQETYGIAQEEADRRVRAWETRQEAKVA